MTTANRPYLVWDADRGVFIVPFHAPPADAPLPQTFAWQPARWRWIDRPIVAGGLVGIVGCAVLIALLLIGWLS